MVDVGTAALQIIPSFEGFQGKLESGSSGAFTSAGSSGGRKFGDSAGKSMSASFKSHAKLAAIAAGAGLASAGYALFKFGQDSIAEARESQRVGALTEQVIKSTGGAAKVTATQVGDLSTALSLKTGIDDEVIQRGANMLLTFKDIRDEVGKNNDIFDQATAVTTDMAAAMSGGKGGEIDLKSSSILVGKALNDPIKGLTALSRVGVSFTEQQKKQIGVLVDQGDKMAAQKIILHELTSEFGGAAAAQATMGDKVKTAWGNIEEKLGTALLPLLEDVERWFLKKGVPALSHFADVFQKKGIPAISNFIDDAKPLAKSILPAMGDALHIAKGAAEKLAPVLKGVFDGFNKLPDSVKTLLVLSAGGAAVAKKVGAFSVGKSLLGTVASKASPMPVFVVNEGFGVPGAGGGSKIPTVLTGAGAAGGATAVGTLPKFAPIIPVGLGSAPGQQSPLQSALGGKQPNTVDFHGESLPIYTKDDLANLDAGNEKIRSVMASVETLPDELITNIALNGAPESKKEAMDLVRQYDLTPKEKRTLFQTYGIPQGKQYVGSLQDLMGKTPREKRTQFGVDGIPKAKNDLLGLSRQLAATAQPRQGSIGINTSAAEANLNRVLNLLNNINRQANMNSDRGLPVPHTPSPRSVAPRTSGPSLSGGGGRQRTSVSVHIGDREFDAYMDERIATHGDMADERKRANR